MGKSQIQYGSQGNDVKELQKLLNQNGYSLTEDGIFGANTQKAVKEYQQKYGLTVDGIVGTNTWGSLLGDSKTANTSTPISAPTLKPTPTAPTYDSTSWDSTEKGEAAKNEYNSAKENVNNHGDFKYGNQEQLDAIMQSILNREKFTYDLNGDALYQQYKDKYIQQGKLAMGDAIGQASAMTGGYGNSYAQSVGQQMYQKELQNLNDIVPELYQMALDKYNMEGQELYNQYGMLTDDYDRGYAQHQDEYGRLMDNRNIARGDYYDGADMFYTEQNNKNSIAGQEFNDAMSIWNSENDNAWKNASWEEDARRYAEEMAYQKERDRISDEQWQKQYDAVYGNKTNTSANSGNTTYKTTQKKVNETVKATKTPEEVKNENTITLNDVKKELNEAIKNGATKSQINSLLRAAYQDGTIDYATYNAFKNTYAPKGYAY